MPDTCPPPCSQLCIFFSHSTNICGKSDQGQLPGPFFVLPVRNSESDDVRFKSPTHSKCSCNYPSPPSTSCVLGTSLACEGDRVTLGKQSEDETRKWIKPANARSGPSVHSAGPLPSLPHEVGREDRTLTTAGLAPAFASLTFRENEQLQSTC